MTNNKYGPNSPKIEALLAEIRNMSEDDLVAVSMAWNARRSVDVIYDLEREWGDLSQDAARRESHHIARDAALEAFEVAADRHGNRRYHEYRLAPEAVRTAASCLVDEDILSPEAFAGLFAFWTTGRR